MIMQGVHSELLIVEANYQKPDAKCVGLKNFKGSPNHWNLEIGSCWGIQCEPARVTCDLEVSFNPINVVGTLHQVLLTMDS